MDNFIYLKTSKGTIYGIARRHFNINYVPREDIALATPEEVEELKNKQTSETKNTSMSKIVKEPVKPVRKTRKRPKPSVDLSSETSAPEPEKPNLRAFLEERKRLNG